MFRILFYASLLLSAVMSLLVAKHTLAYITPILTISLLMLYISRVKKAINPWFILALATSLTSVLLGLTNFKSFFSEIVSSTTLQLIILTLLIKKYLKKSKLKSFLRVDVLISFMFLAYIFYNVLSILKASISLEELFLALICATSLVVFLLIISVIYINDVYSKRIILLSSGILIFIQIALSNINEFLYFSKVITMFILLCHFIGLYLFMCFILEHNVLKDNEITEKFI